MSLILSAFVEKPQSAKFYGEDEGEQIILILRRSLITNFRWLFIGIVSLLSPWLLTTLLALGAPESLATLPFAISFIGVTLWLLFWSAYLFVNFLNWFYNVHIVTNWRIVDMDFSGFLHRDITEAPLRTVQDVTHQISGFLPVLFNFGNVIIQTAGENQQIDFHDVPKPAKASDIISDLVTTLHREDEQK
jgi:membrane protein YdbS with pleckstrin-like domain